LSFSSVGHCARQKFLGVVVMQFVPSDVVVDIFEYAISPWVSSPLVKVELIFRHQVMATLTKNADMALEQPETRRMLLKAEFQIKPVWVAAKYSRR
jgi:hypothetical protein